MKNKALAVAALALIVAAVMKVAAIQVNPASAVLGDSADTPETLVYRDTNGRFSTDGLAVSDVSTSRFHPPALSTTVLLNVSPVAIGDYYTAVDSNGAFVRMCVSSGTTAGAVIIATAAVAAPCRN